MNSGKGSGPGCVRHEEQIMKKRIFWLAAVLLAAMILAGYGSILHVAEGVEITGNEWEKTAEGSSFTEDPSAMEAAAQSVVKLEVFDKRDDRITAGSGFCAFDSRLLVTAMHVLPNMSYMIATKDDGTTFRIDHIITATESADVALCELPEDAGLTPLPTASSLPRRGEKAVAIGSMYGLTNLVLQGDICGIWTATDSEWILFSAAVSPGCSGGPLFNDAGEVIGVVMGSYERAQNLNLASPIEKARNLSKTVSE